MPITYRYRLDGPEPPAHVREVAIGPGAWGPEPYPGGTRWNRSTERFLSRYRPGRFAYLRPWFGYVWRRVDCPRRPCQGDRCYHWSNGDRSRAWLMLRGRARWTEAHDVAALRRLHAAYRHRH